MTALKDKVQNTLDESRMLVLGSQILIGFAFSATFQSGFFRLPTISRNLNLIALSLLLITIGLLIWPAAFHQLAERGNDSARLHGFTTHVMEAALLPFALGMGAEMYVPVERILDRRIAFAVSIGTTATALAFWYGPTLIRPLKGKEQTMRANPEKSVETSVHDKIRHVLTEARVILPGNQALLGFQFAVTLQQAFQDLPFTLKLVHFISLSLIAISTILLLSPAAYHRIVEQGEETEGFYRVANKFVISALPPMALGICGDFLVVAYQTTGRWALSVIPSLLMLTLFCGLWFGYTLLLRNRLVSVGESSRAEVSP
jgi:hypothetical protein